MPWKLHISCKKTIDTRTLGRDIDSLLKMADRVQTQATKRRRKRSECFMKKKRGEITIPEVELTEAPAAPVPFLSSRNKKLALSTQSCASESGPSASESGPSASESGPSTSGSARNEERREGAGDFCFIMNSVALHLIAKTFQCCGSELEARQNFSCRRALVAKISFEL